MNGVLDGGETYTEYLKHASLCMPADAEAVVINIPAQTKISGERVSEIVNRPTQDVELATLPQLSGKDFSLLISNDASLGRYIDTSIKTVFLSHGSSAMPSSNPYLFAEFTSYFDIITSSSNASMQMAANGISLYRSERRKLKIGINGSIIRSDLRHTYLMPTFPMKMEQLQTEMQAKVPTRKFTIGLLPTAVGAIRPELSLYNNLIPIIQMLINDFPQSRVVLRPYPVDLKRPKIMEVCEILGHNAQVTVDSTGSSSSTFYDQCDLVITDASTGGVSFMLRKTVPPIYFVPTAALEDSVTRWFVDLLGERVPMAHTVAELSKHIRDLTTAKPRLVLRLRPGSNR